MSDILARLSRAFDQASCGDGFEVEVLSDAIVEITKLRAALEDTVSVGAALPSSSRTVIYKKEEQ